METSALLVLLESFAGEPEVLGSAVKVETSASVVTGSSEHKRSRAGTRETSHHGWNNFPAGHLGFVVIYNFDNDILVLPSDWSFLLFQILKTLTPWD